LDGSTGFARSPPAPARAAPAAPAAPSAPTAPVAAEAAIRSARTGAASAVRRGAAAASFTCRRCGRLLFGEDDLEPHQGGKHGFGWRRERGAACGSFFVGEALAWMDGSLGGTENKVCCPKCRTKVGTVKWAGAQCSCGTWVTPALQFPMSKVDVKFKHGPQAGPAGTSSARARTRRVLVALWSKHAPEKLPRVDDVLDKYDKRGPALIRAVMEKYGVDAKALTELVGDTGPGRGGVVPCARRHPAAAGRK
jgi:dual specificity phosphatase 12